jgi:hypothetical protein
MFRVDVSRFGLGTGRVVFCGDAGGPITRAHFEPHPLSLEKQPGIRNPRVWVEGALGALALATAAATVRRARREEVRR